MDLISTLSHLWMDGWMGTEQELSSKSSWHMAILFWGILSVVRVQAGPCHLASETKKDL